MARGSILKRQRKVGPVYLARVEYDADPITGKRRQVSETYRTKREAERRLSAWLAEIERGTAVRPDRMTVAELLEQWLTSVAAHQVRETTVAGYRHAIEHHIVPELGSIPVQRLTAARVQAFYATKLSAGTGPRTVQLCHLRLSQALKQAVRWQIVPANVCDNVKAPTVRYKRGGTWDADQLRRFLTAAASDGLWPLWDVLATTGVRRGEALGLRWRDIDLERGTATIAQLIVPKAGAPLIQEPKTNAGRRSLRLLPATIAALKAHRTAWLARKLAAPPELWEDYDLVFCTAIGRPLNPNNIARNFQGIVRAADPPRIRVHDLRHTHATLLLAEGTPVHVVSKRLGHAATSITVDTYAHVLAGQDEAAVVAFDRLLERAIL